MHPTILYFLYAAVGKLLVWVAQTAGIFQPIWKRLESRWPKFEEFHECGWCIGCYLYPVLAYLLNVNIFSDLTNLYVGYIITGVVTSFLIQAISFGLKYWFNWN